MDDRKFTYVDGLTFIKNIDEDLAKPIRSTEIEDFGGLLDSNIKSFEHTINTTFNVPHTYLDEAINSLFPDIGEVTFGVDIGRGPDKMVMSTIRVENQIKNIHRVKKGKRYIIKYERTGLIKATGIMRYE